MSDFLVIFNFFLCSVRTLFETSSIILYLMFWGDKVLNATTRVSHGYSHIRIVREGWFEFHGTMLPKV